LAIYFDRSVTDDEMTKFMSDVLLVPAAGAREGEDHVPGVQRHAGDYEKRVIYVDFFDTATQLERDAVREAAAADPRVRRVELDVAPD
jgi:hypothetical protein